MRIRMRMRMKRMNLKEVSHIYLTKFSLLLNYLSREERQRKEEGQGKSTKKDNSSESYLSALIFFC